MKTAASAQLNPTIQTDEMGTTSLPRAAPARTWRETTLWRGRPPASAHPLQLFRSLAIAGARPAPRPLPPAVDGCGGVFVAPADRFGSASTILLPRARHRGLAPEGTTHRKSGTCCGSAGEGAASLRPQITAVRLCLAVVEGSSSDRFVFFSFLTHEREKKVMPADQFRSACAKSVHHVRSQRVPSETDGTSGASSAASRQYICE